MDDTVPFPCRTEGMRSKKRPKSVHQLRPGDIDIIGAMGDSLTAGIGLGTHGNDLLGIYFEDRGKSFSIGEKMFISEDETVGICGF